jgi:alpha-beta hydrolase superfamily lysophospholipase
LEVYDGFLHEVLNEVGRERVVRDLVEWLAVRG